MDDSLMRNALPFRSFMFAQKKKREAKVDSAEASEALLESGEAQRERVDSFTSEAENSFMQRGRSSSWGGRITSTSSQKTIVDPKAPPAMGQWRKDFLKRFGVNIGSNGHTVLSYNPRIVQSGANIAVVMCFLPRVFTKTMAFQWVALCIMAFLYAWQYSDGGQEVDELINRFTTNLQGLTQFVLGLFVSLVLSKTYYANRGEFGTVFGRTMGFAQMVTAWVRMPMNSQNPQHSLEVQLDARQLLVRWANAAFRLMVLEARDMKPQQIGDQLMRRELLSESEWNHVAGHKSRATHIYQWMNNVLHDLEDGGYIRDPVYVNRMNMHIDDMRAANVWGLPSLPIMYTLLITIMVKIYLVFSACSSGSELKAVALQMGCLWGPEMRRSHLNLVISVGLTNLIFQGLLDIHQVLFHPNQGVEVSHLPSDNFLDFVETVTTDLICKNETLPYETGIGDIGFDGGKRVDTPMWAGLLVSEVPAEQAETSSLEEAMWEEEQLIIGGRDPWSQEELMAEPRAHN